MINRSQIRRRIIAGQVPKGFGCKFWPAITLFVALCLLGCGCTVIAKDQRPVSSTPGSAPDAKVIVVKDVNGKEQRPLAEGGGQGTLFFFVLHDCPAANAYAPEMNRIAAQYGAKGVRSYLVYVESDLGETEARQHAQQHEIGFPALIDRQQQLVKVTGATISPEAALVSADQRVVYHGRIDDRIVAPGKRRVQPTTRDLREALDAMLDGKPVPNRVTPAVGCYLPVRE